MKKYFSLQVLLLLSFLAFSKSNILLPVVNENGKWGYIDTSGEQVIPYQYDLAYNFTEERGLVAVTVNGEYKYSFIDIKGNLYGDWNYTEAHPYNNGVALVRFFIDALNLSWGYVDKNGNFLPPVSCSEARSFYGGFAAVNKMNGWGFINKNFREAIKSQYSMVGTFNEGLCAVAQGRDSMQRWGYINTLGQQVIPEKYIHASAFNNRMASVCVELEDKTLRKPLHRKLYGYIGGNGDFLIPAKYQEASDFHEEIARVKENGIEFFIDVMGNKIFSLDSACHASDFYYGFAVVNTPDGRAYFIDKKGNITYDYNFVSLTDFNNGYSFFTKRNGSQGYVDYHGNIIWKNK